MTITRTIEQNEQEIKKVIDDPETSKQFKDTVELYYNVSDIAKRAEKIKSNVDKKIITNVKGYFNDADQTIVKALQIGDLLVKVGKDATRNTTNYDTDKILSELKKAMPKLESLIEDIYKKHLELSKSPVSPRLYVFKKDEEEKFKKIISGDMNEASDNILLKVLKEFSSNLKQHLMGFLEEKKSIVNDIISSLTPMIESKKYYKGLDANTKEKREKHFDKYKDKPDSKKKSYKPAPGDKDAETKKSKHTKEYDDMYGEKIDEGTGGTAIKNKAEETGISYSILKQVYDRGMAAWKSGHRPGTTPHQWALARINSFATGGKTRQTADKDLWDKHKSKKESKEYNMNENEERSPLIEIIKEKKTEVSACLQEGVDHERLKDLLEEYIAASDIAATATDLKKEISPSIKDEVINLFDVEDSILNKFIEVGDYVVVVCRDSERVSNKKALEGFVDELSKAVPDYVDVIENIMKTNKDVSTVDVKPRTSVKQIDELIVESLSDQFEKVTSYIKGLTRVFSKFLPKLSRHNENLRGKINNLFEEIIISENIKGDHYCVVQPNFAIFGVGKTENEAWNDAEEWADTTDENWKNSFEVKPCTSNVFNYVKKNGTPDDWEEYEGTIVLPSEITDMKEKIEESEYKKGV